MCWSCREILTVLFFHFFPVVLSVMAVHDGSNFWVCGWNRKVWPIKGKLERYSSITVNMIFATSIVEQGPTAIHSSAFLLCLLRCLFRYKHWHYLVLTLKRNPQVGLFKRSSFEPVGSWKKSMLCWLSSAFLWRFLAAYGHVWKKKLLL